MAKRTITTYPVFYKGHNRMENPEKLPFQDLAEVKKVVDSNLCSVWMKSYPLTAHPYLENRNHQKEPFMVDGNWVLPVERTKTSQIQSITKEGDLWLVKTASGTEYLVITQ